MNIITSFIANSQSAKLMQPGQRSLNYPAINTQSAAIFSSAFCQHRFNTQYTEQTAMLLRIISSITKDAVRTMSRMAGLACYRRDGFHQGYKLRNIVAVCRSELYRKWYSVGISNYMVLRAGFASIRGIRACFDPPKTARTDAESATAREKSILSVSLNLFRRICLIFSHTPAFCQSRSRRQQVIPEPQPISLGRYSHPIPLLRTNRIPVNALRSGTGGLPPFGRGGRSGITGFIISHNLSSSSSFAIILSSIRTELFSFPVHSYRTNNRSDFKFC